MGFDGYSIIRKTSDAEIEWFMELRKAKGFGSVSANTVRNAINLKGAPEETTKECVRALADWLITKERAQNLQWELVKQFQLHSEWQKFLEGLRNSK